MVLVEKCVICSSYPGQRFFHRVPCDDQRRMQWIQIISNYLGRYTIHKDSLVCSSHFSPDDYDCQKTGKLKESAIPLLANSQESAENCSVLLKNGIQNDNVDKELITKTTVIDNIEHNSKLNGDLDELILKEESSEEVTIKDEGVMNVYNETNTLIDHKIQVSNTRLLNESSEEIVKDEDVMNISCNEFTNTLIDHDVQMMDEENIGLCSCNSNVNSMVEKTETVQMDSTFEPGTESVNAVNMINENGGYIKEQGVPKEKFIEDDGFEEAEEAFNVLKHSIKRIKESAKEREGQLRVKIVNLEIKLMKQNLYMEDLEKERKGLIDQYEDKLRVCHKENNVLRTLINQRNLEESQDLKASVSLEYKNKLLNLSQELAHIKVKLTNCKEEKAKLEKNLGLEEIRNELEVLKKRFHDVSVSCRLKAIKEQELDQELQTLKSQLGRAMVVCKIVGVRSEDMADLEKVEEKLRMSRKKLLPKSWRSKYLVGKLKKEQVTELARKVEECRQLKKELATFRKLTDKCGNVCRLSDVCEYCGM